MDALIEYVRSLNIDCPRKHALDFGCGVGRLTQALAAHFDEVTGVDISPSMIKLAKKYSRHGDGCNRPPCGDLCSTCVLFFRP